MKRAKPVWGGHHLAPTTTNPGPPPHPTLTRGHQERAPWQSPVQGRRCQDPSHGHCCHMWPVLSPGVSGDSCPPPSLHDLPSQAPGWGSPSVRELQAGVRFHRPGQAPTPLQCPRGAGRARADPPGVGTCPHPAVTWGSNTWPGRGSLWLLQSP